MDIRFASETRELAVLQHLQELRLERRVHLADLVQEDRSMIRVLELAELPLVRPREGALLEAEQLALKQLGG